MHFPNKDNTPAYICINQIMVCRGEKNINIKQNNNINILVDTSHINNQVMSVVCLNISLSVTHIEGDASHLSSL